MASKFSPLHRSYMFLIFPFEVLEYGEPSKEMIGRLFAGPYHQIRCECGIGIQLDRVRDVNTQPIYRRPSVQLDRNVNGDDPSQDCCIEAGLIQEPGLSKLRQKLLLSLMPSAVSMIV